MKLYFSWIDESEKFDPEVHALTDRDILSFSLTEQEGQFPLVTLEIQNSDAEFFRPFEKQWCYVSYDRGNGVELLFKGRVCVVPHHLGGETVSLNFTAQPSQWEEQLQALHEDLKGSPFWDPLFVDPEDQDDPSESLEARSALFFWCRKTGEAKLSDLFWGSHKADLAEKHFYDSLRIRMGGVPLDAVEVSLSVEWVQKYQGETDLSPLLGACFAEGMMNTLTGEDLKAKWWQPHEKIGQSGYWVSRSSLKEITPNYTGPLNLYPSLSESIWISPEDPAYGKDKPFAPQQKRLKRSWFKATLAVGWIYRQKRREQVRFVLDHALQLPSAYGRRTRKIRLNLQNIALADETDIWRPGWHYSKGFRVVYQGQAYRCLRRHKSEAAFEDDRHNWAHIGEKPAVSFSGHSGRFFSTDRGQKAIEHALEIARAHLAASARVIEISVSGPLEDFIDLTCDHSVRIRDDRLSGREAWGKVKSLRFVMEGQTGQQWGEIILGVSAGTGETTKESDMPPSSSYHLDYAETSYHVDVLQGDSPSGIGYHFLQNQENQTKWIQPQALTARDLVEEIIVHNAASSQNKHLLHTQYPLSHNIEAILKEVPTAIYLRLADLRPMGVLTERLQVDISSPWSSPKQIDLSLGRVY